MAKIKFYSTFYYFFTVFNCMFLIAVRQEVNNLECSDVVHELKFAIKVL